MGDARHQKTPSDHNLGNAFDITHDPSNGCDGATIAAFAIQDSRVKYVIFNRRIWNRTRGDRAWRPYNGDNPHTSHCHVSILAGSRNDNRPWGWAREGATVDSNDAPPAPDQAPNRPSVHGGAFPGVLLRRGSQGALVRRVQARLAELGWRLGVDGVFGSDTDRVVRDFQRRRSLDRDGVVGDRTWRALFA